MALCLLGAGAFCHAEEINSQRQSHAWGRFVKGAWRQVQIVTDSFDERGKLTNSSLTDNKTTIEEITPDRVTLKVEVTVEIAGQKFPSQPQLIKQGFAGENVGQTVMIKPLGGEKLLIDGREMLCESEQIEIIGGVSKEVSLVSYAHRQPPLIVKRKSTTSDAASGKTTQESLSEVLLIDLPYNVLDEHKNAYCERMVQKNDHGTTTTLSFHVPEVPGEVVFHTSKKLDTQGRLVRRSTLELVAYSAGGGSDEVYREPVGRRARRHKRGR